MNAQENYLDLLVRLAAERTERDEAEIEIDIPIVSLGLSSVDLVALSGELENRLRRKVSPTVFWEFPTLKGLAAYLAKT